VTRLVIVALLGALVAGCGAVPHVVRSQNPCHYVSAADVAPIVGGPVRAGAEATGMVLTQGQISSSCVFQPVGSYIVPVTGSNALVQFAAVSFVDASTFSAAVAAQSPGASVRLVGGIGDQAFEVASVHVDVLYVARGDYRVLFAVEAGLTSFIAPAERLARVVVPRLPA
jgi:hypothetical protein